MTNLSRADINGVKVFCSFDELVDINQLKPNPKSPNKHSQEQIKLLSDIIKKIGWRASITVSKLSGLIVKGHCKLEAAKFGKFDKVPVEYQNFENEEEEMAALLADNKIAELAEIDDEQLKAIFEEYNFEDISLTGYSDEEYADILDNIGQDDELEEDEIDDLNEETFTQQGDLWILGCHKLICGDSLNLDTLGQLLGREKVSLLITDPPYNVDYQGGTKEKLKIKNDKMDGDEFRSFLATAFERFNEVMKSGAPFYIWHSDSERYNFQGACQDAGWSVRQCLIWVKNSIVMGRQDYQWKHEPCLYGWKSGAHYFTDDRSLSTILEYDRPLKNDLHPTMKPVEMFAELIRNSSRFGEIVLDGFAGSGTTLIACQKLGRSARLVELDERYCDAIVKRFIKYCPREEVKCFRGGGEVEFVLPG